MSSDMIHQTTVAGFPAIETRLQSAKPRLLFLHGAFATHACWRGWVAAFADRGWNATAASFRGRLGVGPERARGVSLKDYLEDALQVIASLDQPPIVIGHSMGGLLAQKIAELGRCRAAVLLAPAPAGMLPAHSRGTGARIRPHLPGHDFRYLPG